MLLVRLVGVTLGRVGWERLICCMAPCILPRHGRLLVRHCLQIKEYKSLVVQYYDISNLQVASLRSLIDPRVGLVGRLLWRSSTVVLRLHLLDRGNRAHQWLGWTSAASRGVSTGVN